MGQFTVLASGSSGNASLLESEGFYLLLDCGLSPRPLGKRLAAVGCSWQQLNAVLLTHTHTDHWNEATFSFLVPRTALLYCHAEHRQLLRLCSPAFGELEKQDRVREYESTTRFALTPALGCRPIPVRHDGGATFGFRFEGPRDLFGGGWAMGYAADLGTWNADVVDALLDVELLALEFNHDVGLERRSGRSRFLIQRVLGDEGHLSNEQGAALVSEIMTGSSSGRLGQVVQLHLSRQCNNQGLAQAALRTALPDGVAPPAIHTASQEEPSPTFTLGAARPRRKAPRILARQRALHPEQPWLPGLT